MDTPIVSILIATKNRSAKLKETLRSLAAMSNKPSATWEAIIVDNDSSDDTRLLIESFIKGSPGNFHYLFEAIPGKSNALNSCIQAAKGKFFAFTDDDCVVDPEWVNSIVSEFSSDPALAVVGGRVELLNKSDGGIAIRTLKERTIFSAPDQLYSLVIGCNMAFSRRVIDEIGWFDPEVGPGSKISSGNDIDILYRAFKKGFKIAYVPRILVWHNHGRATKYEVLMQGRNYLIGRGAFYCKYILRCDVVILRMAYWEVLALLKGLLKACLTGKSFSEEKMCLGALGLGVFYRLRIDLGSVVITRS